MLFLINLSKFCYYFENSVLRRVGRVSESDCLTKHGRDARATGSAGLRVRESVVSQQMKQIKQIEEQKAGGCLNHLLNLFNLL